MNKQNDAWLYGPIVNHGMRGDRLFINLCGDITNLFREADGSLGPHLRFIPEWYTVIGTSDCRTFALIKARDGRSGAVRVCDRDRVIRVHDGKPVIEEKDWFITVLHEFWRQERIAL